MDQRKTAASSGTTSCSELFIAAKMDGSINIKAYPFWKCKSPGPWLDLHVIQQQYVRVNSTVSLIISGPG